MENNQAERNDPSTRFRKTKSPSQAQNEAMAAEKSLSCCSKLLACLTSRRSLQNVLPKVFYLTLQGIFLIVLITLNWDFLTTETEGLIVLVVTMVLVAGTHVFYLLTGGLDPGFVRNQIFASQYETTELFEDEEQQTPQQSKRGGNRNARRNSANKASVQKKKRAKGGHARQPSTVLAELDRDKLKEQQQLTATRQRALPQDPEAATVGNGNQVVQSNQLFCGAYTSNDDLLMQESIVQIGAHENNQQQSASVKKRGDIQQSDRLIAVNDDEQGDRRVSVYYASSQGDSSQVIDLNQIDLGESGTVGKSSHRQMQSLSKQKVAGAGHSGSQSGRVGSRVAGSFAGVMSPGARVGEEDDEGGVRMCEGAASESYNNTEINNFFNDDEDEEEESKEQASCDQLRVNRRDENDDTKPQL